MAYETEDQQNEFFSHYGLSTGHVDSALLSHVAREMYNRIMPDDVVRDGVGYHYLFTGKEAVVSWAISFSFFFHIVQKANIPLDRIVSLILSTAMTTNTTGTVP